MSVHAVSDTASRPLQWRLFVPREWADDPVRRRKTKIPDEVGHREKWRLALDSIDELAGWGMVPPAVVADAGYGQNADFRDGLELRGIDYVVAIRSDVSVHPHDALPTAPAWSGNGRKSQPRYRDKPSAVAALAAARGRQAFTGVTWREGSRGLMRSHFLVLRVRSAGIKSRGHAAGRMVRQRRGTHRLLAVQPARLHHTGRTGPPGQDPLAHRARLPRTQARTRPGPLRGPLLGRLAPPRHPGHRCPRVPHRTAPGPKSRYSGLTLYQTLDTIQDLLNCWTGTCTTCHRPLPRTSTTSQNLRARTT